MKLLTSKECLILLLDAWLLFVALPHVTGLQNELASLRTAQAVRADASEVPTPPTTEAPLKKPRRALSIPEGSEPPTPHADDPFLDEARRRAEQDPAAAMAWLQAQASGSERLRGMLEVVALWAAKDSESALLWLESNAQGIARLETLNSGMALWAQQDPLAAANWIEGMANDGSKVAAAQSLASRWATQNASEAAAWVSSLASGALRDQAAQALVESWCTTDPEKASIWALSEAEFNGNAELLHLSLEQYTESAPEAAEAFLRGLTEAYDAPETIETYVRTRAANDPAATMAWQAQLAPDDVLNQTANARIIMQEWSQTDSVAASTWLSAQAPGAQRDAAIIGFTDTMLRYEPEAATAWAHFITDPTVRTEQLTRSIQSWARSHPFEALKWVKSAELEPALRRQLAAEIGVDDG